MGELQVIQYGFTEMMDSCISGGVTVEHTDRILMYQCILSASSSFRLLSLIPRRSISIPSSYNSAFDIWIHHSQPTAIPPVILIYHSPFTPHPSSSQPPPSPALLLILLAKTFLSPSPNPHLRNPHCSHLHKTPHPPPCHRHRPN